MKGAEADNGMGPGENEESEVSEDTRQVVRRTTRLVWSGGRSDHTSMDTGPPRNRGHTPMMPWSYVASENSDRGGWWGTEKAPDLVEETLNWLRSSGISWDYPEWTGEWRWISGQREEVYVLCICIGAWDGWALFVLLSKCTRVDFKVSVNPRLLEENVKIIQGNHIFSGSGHFMYWLGQSPRAPKESWVF